MSNFVIKEVKFSSLMQYERELKNMFTINTYTYHYPDKEVDASYINGKFDKLLEHIQGDTTYLLGAFDDDKIVGFIWLYERPFMTYKRMIINSLYIAENYRSQGIGKQLMHAAYNKCREVNCTEISTHYATINEGAKVFYMKNGFTETRVEVVKKV